MNYHHATQTPHLSPLRSADGPIGWIRGVDAVLSGNGDERRSNGDGLKPCLALGRDFADPAVPGAFKSTGEITATAHRGFHFGYGNRSATVAASAVVVRPDYAPGGARQPLTMRRALRVADGLATNHDL